MPLPIVGGLMAKFALTKVGGMLGRIPRWVWILLAVVIIVLGARWYHSRQVSAFEKETRTDERTKVNKEWQAKFDKMRQNAIIWKQRYEGESGKLATARRNQHEETLRSDSARASGLLNSGPGKARCGQIDYPNISASSGGRIAGSGTTNASVDRVPDETRADFAAVPFAEFVQRARVCDANRSEVTTWRAHDAEQRALRNKLVSEPGN